MKPKRTDWLPLYWLKNEQKTNSLSATGRCKRALRGSRRAVSRGASGAPRSPSIAERDELATAAIHPMPTLGLASGLEDQVRDSADLRAGALVQQMLVRFQRDLRGVLQLTADVVVVPADRREKGRGSVPQRVGVKILA